MDMKGLKHIKIIVFLMVPLHSHSIWVLVSCRTDFSVPISLTKYSVLSTWNFLLWLSCLSRESFVPLHKPLAALSAVYLLSNIRRLRSVPAGSYSYVLFVVNFSQSSGCLSDISSVDILLFGIQFMKRVLKPFSL